MEWRINNKKNENISEFIPEPVLYKPSFERYLDYDENNNPYYYTIFRISGEVDYPMLEAFLQIENDFHSREILTDSVSEIRIVFSSGGGSVDIGIQICDFLREWNKINNLKISFVCSSMIGSMAISIVCCGYKVYSYKDCAFLIHDISSATSGREHDMNGYLDFLKIRKESIARIIKDKTGMNINKIKALFNNENYFDVKTAQEYKIVDSIIDYK